MYFLTSFYPDPRREQTLTRSVGVERVDTWSARIEYPLLILCRCWQGDQGSEFRVNTYTTHNQLYPSVAMNRDGNFVITWQS
jgi:hypothetical protein